MTKADIQFVRSLDDKRVRDETGLFVCEGEKLVREMVASGLVVRRVYMVDSSHSLRSVRNDSTPMSFRQRSKTDEESQLISAAVPAKNPERAAPPAPDPPAERVSPAEMGRISRLKTPTDVLALVEIPRRRFIPASLQGRLTLALDGVQNPGNMGTIIRLADWFGVGNILCSSDSADCFSPKVVQATMGAIARVSLHYGDLRAMIAAAVGSPDSSGNPDSLAPTDSPALPVYGTFLEGDSVYGASLSAAGIVVLGSEGRGISPAVARLADRRLFIPPFPPDSPSPAACPAADLPSATASSPESLNVSIAAAIICSEFRRPR